MKNISRIIGHYLEVKGKLKQRIAFLIHNDYLLVEGKQDEVIGRIQARSGRSKEQVLKYISEMPTPFLHTL
jgi:uncharacterized protein YjbJ (UPF0337 family)